MGKRSRIPWTTRRVPRQWVRGAAMIALALFVSLGSPPAAAYAQGGGKRLLVLTFFNGSKICLGDSRFIPLTVSTSDGSSPAASVTAESSKSAPDRTSSGRGGGATVYYKPDSTGPDTITITAAKQGYAAGVATVWVRVIRCQWRLELLYTGGYANPDFPLWSHAEGMAVKVLIEADADGALSGEGTVRVGIRFFPLPGVRCENVMSLSGTGNVKVTGNLGDEQLRIELQYDSVRMIPSSGGAMECRKDFDYAKFTGLRFSVGPTALGLNSLILPVAGGHKRHYHIPEGVFWLGWGSGEADIWVTRVESGP